MKTVDKNTFIAIGLLRDAAQMLPKLTGENLEHYAKTFGVFAETEADQWTFEISRADATPDLLATLKDLELRMTQDRIAVGIGKNTKQRQIDFLIGSLVRMGKIAAEAIAKAEGKL